jgi:putative addiction module component (TIGR02574 family)
MSKSRHELLSEVLHLPPLERVTFVDRILASFDPPQQAHLDALWAAEAEDRLEAWEAGHIGTVSAEEVLKRFNRS